MNDFALTLWLTFRLASITTIILLIIAVPLARWLAFSKFKSKPVLEALISMPLVLPPTVLGFYLLLAFSPEHFPGSWLAESIGLNLAFSFSGLVIGSVIYSLPFMVQPLQSGYEKIPTNIIDASYTLGKSKMQTLWKVILPNMKPALLTGIVLSFAHTIGEFGVVLMIGGNIPGETRVASIAIFEEVEAFNYDKANQYAMVLFAFTFGFLLLVYFVNQKWRKGAA